MPCCAAITSMAKSVLPVLPDKQCWWCCFKCVPGAILDRMQANMHGTDCLLCRCVVDVADIDEMNILQAALKAMEGAVAALPHTPPDYLLVDGNQLPRGLNRECSQTVVRGDSKSTVIAAASVLAKASVSTLLVVTQLLSQFLPCSIVQAHGLIRMVL